MKKYLIFPLAGMFLILLDQISKYAFEHFFAVRKIHLIGDFLVLSFAKNTGIAFSFPIEGMILKILTIALILGIVIYFFRHEPHKDLPITRWGYVFVLS